MALLASFADLPPPAVPGGVTVERSLYLMGTRLELIVEGTHREAAVAASEAGLEALEQAEARLSTWSETSELAQFNRSLVGIPFPSSPDLWRELRDAVACAELTGGAFDPGVGRLVEVWGLRRGGRRPSDLELATAVAATGTDGLEFPTAGTLVRARAEVAIEEGGFGKGAGLDRAVERIAATPGATVAVLDLGGQVVVWRAMPTSEPVAIAVADPMDRAEPVLTLAIDSGSLSTTGSSERGITVDGRRYSHVLDPRTGMPAADFGSVTVWAPSALLADCLSTGLYVLGAEGIERWSAAHPEIGVVVVEADRLSGTRVALASANLAGRITRLAPDLEVRIWAERSSVPPISPTRRTRPLQGQ